MYIQKAEVCYNEAHYIVAMNTKLPKIIVAALIEKNDKILLIKERLEDNKEHWIVPGGTVEFGESLEEALKREIKEETGLVVDAVKYIDFTEAIYVNYDYHTVIFFFSTKPLNENITLDQKILDAQFFKKEEIKKLDLITSAQWILDRYLA